MDKIVLLGEDTQAGITDQVEVTIADIEEKIRWVQTIEKHFYQPANNAKVLSKMLGDALQKFQPVAPVVSLILHRQASTSRDSLRGADFSKNKISRLFLNILVCRI